MNIIDATTVSALLVVLALAVLATVVTAGVVLARVYGASRPTPAAHRRCRAVVPGRSRPGRRDQSLTDQDRRSRTRASGPAALHFRASA